MITIFPQCGTGVWGFINLNDLSRPFRALEPNPLLDQKNCSIWINEIHSLMGVDFSCGGYMELRDSLWRGSYLPKEPFHLGVDYNVPAGMEVTVPLECEIIQVIHDPDQNGGWGGRLIFKYDKYLGIMAHLKLLPEITSKAVGSKLKKWQLIGHVAEPGENGGWFPHMHVQLTTEKYLSNKEFDGYSEYTKTLTQEWIDPFILFPKPDLKRQKKHAEMKIFAH